jgi:hypothetical protein
LLNRATLDGHERVRNQASRNSRSHANHFKKHGYSPPCHLMLIDVTICFGWPKLQPEILRLGFSPWRAWVG